LVWKKESLLLYFHELEPGGLKRKMSNRREFIKNALIGGAAVFVTPVLARHAGAGPLSHLPWGLTPPGEGWSQLPEILRRIKPPVFPRRDFVVTGFGAVGDGRTDCTNAFGKAIAECHKRGGGRVVIPGGDFLTGPIHLKSNVNLHLTSSATLRFSQDPSKYLPLVFSRWEGMELMNYSPFIYAFEQKNIAITGSGTLDGQSNAEAWWPWNGRDRYGWKEGAPTQRKARTALVAMIEENVPVAQRIFGEGHYLRPQFIQPYRCQNVLIKA